MLPGCYAWLFQYTLSYTKPCTEVPSNELIFPVLYKNTKFMLVENCYRLLLFIYAET